MHQHLHLLFSIVHICGFLTVYRLQLSAGLGVSIGLAITLCSKFTVHYAGLGILVSRNDVDIKV